MCDIPNRGSHVQSYFDVGVKVGAFDLRVLAGRPSEPKWLTFTLGDARPLFDVGVKM